MFEKIKRRPMNTLKVAMYLILINLLGVLPLMMGNPLLVIGLSIPVGLICPFFLYGAYEKLFDDNEPSTFGALCAHTLSQIKLKGWRMFGVNIIYFTLNILIFMGLGFVIIQMLGEAFVAELDPTSLFAGQLDDVLGLTFIALLLMGLVEYFIKYVQIGISLGHDNVVKHAIKQWKQILIVTVFINVIGFIPLLGQLALFVFYLMIPLKMIIDTKALEGNTNATNDHS